MGTSESKPGFVDRLGCACVLTPLKKLRKRKKVCNLGKWETSAGSPSKRPSESLSRKRSQLPPGVILVTPTNTHTSGSEDEISKSEADISESEDAVSESEPDSSFVPVPPTEKQGQSRKGPRVRRILVREEGARPPVT